MRQQQQPYAKMLAQKFYSLFQCVRKSARFIAHPIQQRQAAIRNGFTRPSVSGARTAIAWIAGAPQETNQTIRQLNQSLVQPKKGSSQSTIFYYKTFK